jgi:hypothetical protein
MDDALSKREMNQVRTHLSECQTCRNNLEILEDDLHLVITKMELLEPRRLPEVGIEFIPPGRKKLNILNLFEYWKWQTILKPVFMALIFLVLSLALIVLLIQSPGVKNDSPWTSTLEPGTQFAIHWITVENQLARTYIVAEQESNTTLVWVERMKE